MSKWGKLLGVLRFGAAIAIAKGAKVGGIPLSVIVEEAEKDGPAIVQSVKRVKASKPPKVKRGSTGE